MGIYNEIIASKIPDPEAGINEGTHHPEMINEMRIEGIGMMKTIK